MFRLQEQFRDYNLRLVEKENISLIEDDGFNYLINSNEKYDLIINNVPTPQYSAASNIWTLDFLQIAKTKLVSGGVYSQWIDGAINPQAAHTVLATLQRAFSYCYLAVLSHKYNNLICSDQPIALNLERLNGNQYKEVLSSVGLSSNKELSHFLLKLIILQN